MGTNCRLAVVACVLVAGLQWSGASTVRADAGEVLRKARHALTTYTFSGDGTVQWLEELDAIAERASQRAHRREARFLRAAVSAELIVGAARLGDDALMQDVADIWGTNPDALVPRVQRALHRTRRGQYANAARDVLAGLKVVRAQAQGKRVPWRQLQGSRRDVLYVGAVREAATRARGATEALARLGEDPCAPRRQGASEDCPQPMRGMAAASRHAAAAVKAAQQAIGRLEEAGEGGDPLARALSQVLEADREALSGITLTPPARLAKDAPTCRAPSQVETARVDLVVLVRPGEVHYGWVPRVRVSQGELARIAPGKPMLPDTEKVAMPEDFRPAVRAVARITQRLTQVREGAGSDAPRLGFGASADTPGHVLARVVMSARKAGFAPETFVGRGQNGLARGVAVNIHRPHRNPAPDTQVRVRVRLAGYQLTTPRGSREFPRVRGDAGLRFDVDGLVEAASRRAIDTASLHFMTVVPVGPIAAAAFGVAPGNDPLALVLP